MFDYQKHKKVALAISTCNFEYRHKEWGEYGSYEERDTLQDISSLAIFPSKSHNFELIKSFFNLYHLPYSDFDETFPFYDNTTQISTQLEDYLKDFKILIGIPIYGYLYYSQFHGMNYSFKFYQLLAYFLQPFGKIGFVPVIDCSPSSFEPAILPLPNSYIAEVAEPERLVIQGESILNLIINEQISSNSQKVDVSVFYHYWDETPKCSFNDFVLNKYSEQIKEIKR